MNVWFARDAATVRNSTAILAAPFADVRASFTYSNDDETAIADSKQPANSADTSIPRWTSWPRLGVEQQIDITLKKRMSIKSIAIYWYDDDKGVKLPVKWRVERKMDDNYFDIVVNEYGTKADCFNKACTETLTETDKLRIYVTPQKDAAVGILEILIEEEEEGKYAE